MRWTKIFKICTATKIKNAFISSTKQRLYLMVNPFNHFSWAIKCLPTARNNSFHLGSDLGAQMETIVSLVRWSFMAVQFGTPFVSFSKNLWELQRLSFTPTLLYRTGVVHNVNLQSIFFTKSIKVGTKKCLLFGVCPKLTAYSPMPI